METNILCPSCRKSNAVTVDLRICARCGCELTALITISALAQDRVRQALVCLADGDYGGATQKAEESWALQQSENAARIGFLATGALGDFEAAEEWRELLKN